MKIIVIAILLFLIGPLTSFSADWFGKNAPPLTIDRVPEIISMLRAIPGVRTSTHGLDVWVSFWGDGTVNVNVKLNGDNTVSGRGDTLEVALISLESKMRALSTVSAGGADNVRAILNQGKSSQ